MSFYNLILNQFLSPMPRQIFSRIDKEHNLKRNPENFVIGLIMYTLKLKEKATGPIFRNMVSFSHKFYHLGSRHKSKFQALSYLTTIRTISYS